MNVVGVDLGGTNIRSAVVDENGKILGENPRPTLRKRPYKEILSDIISSIQAAAAAAGISCADIAAIGIGSPGPLDYRSGVILSPPNLPTFRGVPLGEDLRKFFGVPVEVGNDADLFALGEFYYGAGRAYRDRTVVVLTLGTGLGIGLIWNGMLYRGEGMGPEICHNSSIDNCGRLCEKCGRRGCPEAHVASYGILQTARERCLDITDVAELQPLFEQGNPIAEGVIRETGQYLGRILATVVHSYHPKLIILGGSIAQFRGPFLKEAYNTMKHSTFPHMMLGLKIFRATLGGNAGVLGAARLALDSVQKGGA